ncbi:serine/arginine-rich splicing factor SC35-like [Magnolia sinica]|uniref:serine/arginine-rich splicing factor SC35-like n=1 Tax=Magnolia sinica TaxID=86752 RepID=UPI002659C0D4|nr:serine/arginine-rich splicing factor SC35-like [Magnolia sinica]
MESSEWEEVCRKHRGTFSIFTVNISLNASIENLQRIFGHFSRIVDIYKPWNDTLGHPRGFAFIRFREEKDAVAALQALNRKMVDGRILMVDRAKPRSVGPSGPSRELQNPPLPPPHTRPLYQSRLMSPRPPPKSLALTASLHQPPSPPTTPSRTQARAQPRNKMLFSEVVINRPLSCTSAVCPKASSYLPHQEISVGRLF